MGDRIAVMRDGLLQQVGTPQELYTRPANVFVGRFIGSPSMNVVSGGVMAGVGANGALVGFRPEHIEVGEAKGDAITFEARVDVVEYLGDQQLLHLRVGEATLLAKISIDHAVGPGEERIFAVEREKIHLFDAESERALAVASAA